MKKTAQASDSKARKGEVGIESKDGRLRLSLPRAWFDGQQKRFALNLTDTPENWKKAELVKSQIERDYALDSFDPTLKRYKPQSFLTPVTAITQAIPTTVELWERYIAYKSPSVKASTRGKHRQFTALFNKLPKLPVTDALAVKDALEKVTTKDMAKRALEYLSTACRWGVDHKLVTDNPYARMAKDMGQYNYQKKSQANAFTKEERDRIIEAFKTDTRKGTNYRPYAPFVEFLFLTGCRHSEAIGLRWEHIDLERRLIHFRGSITQSGDGKQKWVDGSKTNSERDFPYTDRLHTLLVSISACLTGASLPVFPSPRGTTISLDNFGKRAWNAVVDPIKPGTTVYSTRDTFITIQRQNGANLADIERWCDTSAEMIRKHYADSDKLADIRPVD